MDLSAQARDRWINVALYQAGWFACVLGAAGGWAPLGGLIAISLTVAHLLLARERPAELRLILVAGLLAFVAEPVQLSLGALAYTEHDAGSRVPPLWIVALWLQFATLFGIALAWLQERLLLAVVLGAIGGPLAFLAGERLGAATVLAPRVQSLAVLAVLWATAVPLLAAVARAGGPSAGYALPHGRRPSDAT